MPRATVSKATTAIVCLLIVACVCVFARWLSAAGGGLDIGLTRHIAVRAFEADYYLTRFDNGVNDHQNNLRIDAGVVIRLGGGK
jgi:hypothetical protein